MPSPLSVPYRNWGNTAAVVVVVPVVVNGISLDNMPIM
jgi:hypothetical protein